MTKDNHTCSCGKYKSRRHVSCPACWDKTTIVDKTAFLATSGRSEGKGTLRLNTPSRRPIHAS